jgi:two-component system, cell cycle response regulator
VLAPWGSERSAEALVELARAALSSDGDGFKIGASCGYARIPDEGLESSDILRIADRRLYAEKNSGRVSALAQSKTVLLRAVGEWDEALSAHGLAVSALAADVARELGLDEETVERVATAAELHDLGKIAIPRPLLLKPGPLTDDEWEFVRRHTLIGERVLAAAPALGQVARLVRSTHERYDGTGYPDGLTGQEIPLGARIIAVCDAFDAMTSDRPHAAGMTVEQALRELLRCAGTQFDPEVVEAFNAVYTELRGELVA